MLQLFTYFEIKCQNGIENIYQFVASAYAAYAGNDRVHECLKEDARNNNNWLDKTVAMD